MFPIKLRPNKTTHKNSIKQKIKNTRRTNTKKYENLSVFEFIYCGKKYGAAYFIAVFSETENRTQKDEMVEK